VDALAQECGRHAMAAAIGAALATAVDSEAWGAADCVHLRLSVNPSPHCRCKQARAVWMRAERGRRMWQEQRLAMAPYPGAISSAARLAVWRRTQPTWSTEAARGVCYWFFFGAQAIVSVGAGERRGCAGTRPAACGRDARDTGHVGTHRVHT
jgi:hypothetical protein